MRLLSISLVLVGLLAEQVETQTERLTELRQWHEAAYRDKVEAEKFYNDMTAGPDSLPALELAYKGAAAFMMSYHDKNPHAKLKYFLEGRELIDRAVNLDPANPEIRFLRFSVQTNAPDFLRYQREIAEDKSFLLETLTSKVKNKIDAELQETIISYMLRTRFCSKSEKKALKRIRETR